MSNYGEELAYWYLRLNGFFPITNFVIHSRPHHAEADILAIRPPNVSEEIRVGRKLVCDNEIVSDGEESKNIFVYCEVKTGDNYEIDNLFNTERIKYALRRFGLNPETTTINGSVTPLENGIFKKVLIGNINNMGVNAKFIDLDDVIKFICKRFRENDAHKYGSRLFFNSSLTQLLIHLAHNPSLIENINSLVHNPSRRV